MHGVFSWNLTWLSLDEAGRCVKEGNKSGLEKQIEVGL